MVLDDPNFIQRGYDGTGVGFMVSHLDTPRCSKEHVVCLVSPCAPLCVRNARCKRGEENSGRREREAREGRQRERAGQGDSRGKQLPNNHFGSKYKAS